MLTDHHRQGYLFQEVNTSFHLNFTFLIVLISTSKGIYIAVLEHLPSKKDWFQETDIFNSISDVLQNCLNNAFHSPLSTLQFFSNEVKKLLDCSHTNLKQSFWDRVAVSHPQKIGKKLSNRGQNFSIHSVFISFLSVKLPAFFITYTSPGLISEFSRLTLWFTRPECIISFQHCQGGTSELDNAALTHETTC